MHKALGSEVRQRILLSLSKGDKYLSEIANEIGLSPQTADFHLGILSDIGIVSSSWEGGKKYYHLRDKHILEFLKGTKPIPPEFRPKPPHEIVLDAWKDLSARLDTLEKKIDRLQAEVEKANKKR